MKRQPGWRLVRNFSGETITTSRQKNILPPGLRREFCLVHELRGWKKVVVHVVRTTLPSLERKEPVTRRFPEADTIGNNKRYLGSDIGAMDLTFARAKQRLEKYRGKNIIFKREYLERNSIHFVATILINLGLFF